MIETLKIQSCSRVHLSFQERLTDFLQIQGLVYSSARLGTSSTIPIVLSLLPVKTGCEELARFEDGEESLEQS